jgi:DNA modification methylase
MILKTEKPSILLPNTQLIHSRYEDVVDLVPDASVDFIFADIPYGTTKAKWDTPLDLEEMWRHLKRIRKPNTAIVLFAQTPFDKVLGVSNIKEMKYEWIWEKTQATGFQNAKKMPMKAHENLLVFYSKPPKYFPQKTTGHKPINKYTKKAAISNKTELYGKMSKDVSGGGETDRYPRSVLKFASDKQKNKLDGTIHSTQKPRALVRYMLDTYSEPGDVVLDFTTGSGTTNLECMVSGRISIGIEKDETEYQKAVHRLSKEEGFRL